MEFSPSVKRQIKISIWILAIYSVALLIYLHKDIQSAMMTGNADITSEEAPYSELTWELLVLDPQLRIKLWARYDHSPEGEREKAFLAVLHVMDSLSPDQAEHLAKNLLERSGSAADREHRKKLLDMLERLGSKFTSAMKSVAHFAAKALGSPLENQGRKQDVHQMMDNIARETKDTGYKYCLQGNENEIKHCTERLVEEKHPSMETHIRNFLKTVSTAEEKSVALIVVAKNKIPFGKEYVPGLLESNNAFEIKTGLRLVREYDLVQYRAKVDALRRSRYDSIVEEVDQTLAYLAARSPANH